VSPDSVKVTGTLKFFYEGDHYGFLVGDSDNKDVFFHFDDMKDTNLSKDQLFQIRETYTVRFAYNKLAYFGRYGLSMKAINIELVEMIPKTTSPSQIPIIQ
jgi:cold shock CspA family protein